MKNYIKKIGMIALFIAAITGCAEDDHSFGDLIAPTNLEVQHTIVGADANNINGDGSGFVDFVATADNAISYKFIFSDGGEVVSPTGILRKRFNTNGVNTYTVTVLASGTGGLITSTTFEVTVFSDFSDPETEQFLTGGASKTWYWAAAEPGHLGVGQNDSNAALNYFPNYYAAAPFEKAGSPTSSCLYDNELTFTMDNGIIKYTLDNGGQTFFNASFLSAGGGAGSEDACLAFDTSGEKTVLLGPSESVVVDNGIPTQTTGTQMTFSDGGFMGYYIGTSTYEILSITANRMVVRAEMGGNPALAWYHIFSTSPPVQGGGGDNFTNLVWSDEFDVPGAPNAANWNMEIGAGGWGNNEAQYYTNSSENAVVQDGVLKITAKAQNMGGANYTSARLTSENKFEFEYGRVDVRAKLPTGGGTWPAIWMLGENYSTAGWPASGEIDIMEHKGNQPGTIHGTLHLPGSSGGNGNSGTTTVSNVSTEFHVYSVVWTATTIQFLVDDEVFHTFANNASTPFNNPFFMILNVAMGGTFGGTIDPAFTQSSMEVDYVRVYQ
jgi:hypothetical protein